MLPSESRWRLSEGAKNALSGAGVGGPCGEPVGPMKSPCGPVDSPCGGSDKGRWSVANLGLAGRLTES